MCLVLITLQLLLLLLFLIYINSGLVVHSNVKCPISSNPTPILSFYFDLLCFTHAALKRKGRRDQDAVPPDEKFEKAGSLDKLLVMTEMFLKSLFVNTGDCT